jgi:hypothetical protein
MPLNPSDMRSRNRAAKSLSLVNSRPRLSAQDRVDRLRSSLRAIGNSILETEQSISDLPPLTPGDIFGEQQHRIWREALSAQKARQADLINSLQALLKASDEGNAA